MLALPPLMALGGSTLFAGTAYASIAATAGWMIGSWILNRNNKQENEVLDPGAEEMPRFNQALRGVTIPVLFGTNKVSSQIIGQWNFNAIREETNTSGGGGKSGGSGGGGKVGQQEPGSISYTYKWDLIYHLGMSHERLFLYGGWVGVTKLTDATIAAIIRSQSSFGTLGSTSSDQPPKEADLQFDDAFFNDAAYGDGIVTGDDVIWDHLEDSSVIGQEIRWPGTTWVGFQQLLLGPRPNIPQLSFEVGPGVGLMQSSEGLQWYTDNPITVDETQRGNTFDENGAMHYAGFARAIDGTQISISARTLINDWYSANGGPDISTGSGVDRFEGPIGNGEYILLAWERSLSDQEIHIAICSINEGAAPTVLGAVYFERTVNQAESISNAFICGNQTNDDPIILQQARNSIPSELEYTIMPSINDIINGVFSTGWGASVYNTSSNIASWGNWEVPYFSYQITTSNSAINWGVGPQNISARKINTGQTDQGHQMNSYGFALPVASIGLGITYHTRIYHYFNKSTMEAHRLSTADHPVDEITNDIQPAQPNGAMVYWDFGLLLYTNHQPETVSSRRNDDDYRLSSYTIDSDSDWEDFPFTDELFQSDGVTVSKNSYEMKPYIEKHESGGYVVIFHMNYVNSTDQEVSGFIPKHLYTKLRGYVWNPILGQAAKIGEFSAPSLVTTDTGETVTGSTKLWSGRSGSIWRNKSTGELFLGGVETNDISTVNSDASWVVKVGIFLVGQGDDITPAEIIYNILTNEIYGLGISTGDINQTAYEDAIAYCNAQNFKVSTQYRREASNILSTVAQLLELYGGFLTISQEQIKFGVLEFTASPVRVIDNHHLIKDTKSPPVNVIEGAHQDTINRVLINFLDRDLDYLQNQIVADDEADQEQYGVRKIEFPPQFVMPEDMATTLAWRTLYSNLYTKDVFNFKLGIKDADLEPGDVITLVDSYHPYLEEGIDARITTWKEVSNGVFDVTAREELEYIMVHSQSPLNISSLNANSGANSSLVEPDYQVIYELPCAFQSSDQGFLYAAYVAKNGKPFGATAYISPDGVTFGIGEATSPYPLGGRLITDLPDSPQGSFQENVEVLLFPDSAWTVNSPAYYFNETLPAATAAIRAAGGALMYAGSEMLAYEGVTLMAQNRYRLDRIYRGWGGTFIHNHNSGDFWHKHGSGIFSQGINDTNIGNKIQIKIAPVRFNGTQYDVASVNPSCYTIIGAHYIPQNAPQPRYIANSVDYRERTLINVGSDGDISVDWRDSARKSGFGTKGYGVADGGYGRFTTDVSSTQWRVEIVGSGDTVVRSISVGSPGYTYTNSNNFDDNGAWRGNVAIKVTPYNPNGLAPRVSVLSLELFS